MGCNSQISEIITKYKCNAKYLKEINGKYYYDKPRTSYKLPDSVLTEFTTILKNSSQEFNNNEEMCNINQENENKKIYKKGIFESSLEINSKLTSNIIHNKFEKVKLHEMTGQLDLSDNFIKKSSNRHYPLFDISKRDNSIDKTQENIPKIK